MDLALRFAARSDIGLGRYTNNQDSGYAGPHLLVIADGMGGHAAGDVASSTAIARLAPLDDEATGSGDALERLTTALREANQDLRDRAAADPTLHGMGTTLTALLRSDDKLTLAHIGDSRAYLLREGVLSQITHDHTFVQSLVDDGRLTEEEARSHPQRNLITRVLSGGRDDTPDVSVREAKPGDTYLLCSDGLTGVVGEETLAEVLGDGTDVGHRAETLLDLALKGGSSDNITCIVADVVDLDVVAGPSTVPEVVGAAAVHQVLTSSGANSPAGKAAALSRQAAAGDGPDASGEGGLSSGAGGLGDSVAADDSDEPKPRRHKGFLILALVVVLGLLGGGGYLAYSWSQDQYFVGADKGNITIFRGLPQDVGPVHLSSVYERQPLTVAELPSYWREQVQQRITADDLAKAREVVANLEQQAEACSTASTPTSTPTATATPTSASTSTTTSAASPTTSSNTSVDNGCGDG